MSSRVMRVSRDNGSKDCTSRDGYNRLRTVLHSSNDFCKASSVLLVISILELHEEVNTHFRDGITRCRCLS